MNILYRRLLDVEIRHDYFLLPGAGVSFTEDYDVRTLLKIEPSAATRQFLHDHRMTFRTSRTGFTIFVEAEQIQGTSTFVSVVDLEADMKLSFYWYLLNPHFLNYTNHRVIENGKKIYYFSNQSASTVAPTIFLNKAIAAFGTTYLNEPLYRLGDLIHQGGETYEMIDKESPTSNFPANLSRWQKINTAVVNYVNPGDRLRWLSKTFRHQRANTSPGEFITYNVLDADGNAIALPPVTGTSQPQTEYTASVFSFKPVDHTLDLSSLHPGKYTIKINQAGPLTQESFYLLDAMNVADVFAISEFSLLGVPAGFQFAQLNATLNRWVIDNTPKNFLVRFRNRLTRWQYFRQDQSLYHESGPRPLSFTYSAYQPVISGSTVNLPDPKVNRIIPDAEPATRLIRNVYSPIFL
jgi:hypothetical protein